MFQNPHTTKSSEENRVLQPGFRKSRNFFQSDKILRHFLKKYCSKTGFDFMQNKWEILGEQLATEMDLLSMQVDKNNPVLKKRNAFGEAVNEIIHHPAYETLKGIAVASGMFQVKWGKSLRQQFKQERHTLGFASGFLFTLGELGLYCPLCMTDGVARIIDRFATLADQERLLPRIATLTVEELMTGAMFLTEKSGGSDVGANLVTASHFQGAYYYLNGEKWFCSNADADLILALARTNPDIKGTKGLSIFLIEKNTPDRSVNHKNIVRLKDKIGVRSMASAEIILENTVGKLIGEEGQGFKIMTEMINLSRLYNSISAMGIMRRVLVEAYQYLSFRKTFGKMALTHSLVRDKLAEMAAIHQVNFYFGWRTVQALDRADNGDNKAEQLLRLLTPMLKKTTAHDAVYMSREAMEAIGGIAYIEESIIPKNLRDALVLPIWEGAGNIMTLDMIRAAFKSSGLHYLFEEITSLLEKSGDAFLVQYFQTQKERFETIKALPQDDLELNGKYFFENLTKLYKICLLYQYRDEKSKVWIDPAIAIIKRHYFPGTVIYHQTVSEETLKAMISWDF